VQGCGVGVESACSGNPGHYPPGQNPPKIRDNVRGIMSVSLQWTALEEVCRLWATLRSGVRCFNITTPYMEQHGTYKGARERITPTHRCPSELYIAWSLENGKICRDSQLNDTAVRQQAANRNRGRINRMLIRRSNTLSIRQHDDASY